MKKKSEKEKLSLWEIGSPAIGTFRKEIKAINGIVTRLIGIFLETMWL